MQRKWCIPEYRPLRIHGHRDGAHFVLKDLCEEGALDELYRQRGSAPFRGWQRFQKKT